jgi:isoleucyl-tRNA synthetase
MVHHFCANEMGSFYLDITKDRQYTMQADSLGRRSSQTAMYHIIEALTRWIAPILTFTADELWEYLPGERNESVILNTWYEGLSPYSKNAEITLEDWKTIFNVRNEVSKELEAKRSEGEIKSGLTAEIDLFANEGSYQSLKKLGDELKFIFITSKLTWHIVERPESPNALAIKVKATEYERCDRCWHQVESVQARSEYDDAKLCDRCIDNIEGAGETRQFA